MRQRQLRGHAERPGDLIPCLAIRPVEAGLAEAKRISEEAGEIMKLGGLLTEDGRRALNELDRNLAERGLNPGSTADLVATALFTAILTGLRS